MQQRSLQRHGASSGWGSRQQQQMLRKATVANAVAVESKRSTKKQLNFPFTRIQVRPHCLIELRLYDQAVSQLLYGSHGQPVNVMQQL